MNEADKHIVGFLLSFFMAHVEASNERARLRRVAAKHDAFLLSKSNYPRGERFDPAKQS